MERFPIISAEGDKNEKMRCDLAADVTFSAESAGGDTRPRIKLAAYNGGPMRLGGWKFPVIIDGAGVKLPAANIPIYASHNETIENLLGQTDAFSVESDGRINAEAPFTGESATCKQVMAHAKNGFKWQASVNALPNRIEFVPEGESRQVNGRPVVGPVVVARAVTLTHIAVVPLGADTTTSAKIAAQQAAQENSPMLFEAWLKAEYGLDASTLSDDQRAKFQAKFDASQQSDEKTKTPAPEIKAGSETVKPPVPDDAADIQASIERRRAAVAADDERMNSVRAEAKDHPAISAKAVKEGWSVEKTQLEVMRAERAGRPGTGAPAVMAGVDVTKISAERVVEAAVLISAGYSGEKLVKDRHYGEQVVNATDHVFRSFGHGIGPAGLAKLVARHAGVSLPDNHKSDEFWREALGNPQIWTDGGRRRISAEFSTMSLPTILSNLMNKFLLEGYSGVDPDACNPSSGPAWQKFVKRGPVQDFKPHYRLRLVGDLEFQSLGQGGEIQQGKVNEQSYKVQAETKAIMFGLTRKDLINDDLSAISSLPTHFGIGSGRTIAKAIYAALIAGLQSDGSTAFFTGTDVTTAGAKMLKNLIASNALSFSALETAKAQMDLQTDPNGWPAGLVPEVLLVPPALAGLAMQLYQSEYLIPSVSTGGNARGVPQNNTLKGLMKPVCSAYLTNLASGSATTWWLMTGAGSPAYAIEAGFLNGQEMPIVERAEADFDRLGIGFRGFVDFGVAMAEPRAAVKCTA